MPKALPEEWVSGNKRSLNVATDLGLRGVPAGNLVIYKYPPSKNSKLLLCRWLPIEDEDTREFKGRTNGGKGKRKYLEGTTGHQDPFQAGKSAIVWCVEQRKQLQAVGEQKDFAWEHSLQSYWEKWWKVERTRLENKQTGDSRIRDREQQWIAPDWGIGSQDWSKKKIDKVNYQDLQSYWEVLDRRATPTNDMKGTKEGQRTLINKVFKQAMKSDFPELRLPQYPEIVQSISKPAVKHLVKQQWESVLKCLVELSGGVATQKLSKKEYWDLEFDSQNRKNQRNWVDLHDTLLMLWFFHLRATDPHVVMTEMFYSVPDEETEKRWKVDLASDKNARDIITTTHYRDSAVAYMDRIKARKPTGYLCFPYMDRPAGSPKKSKVVEKANDLLKDVLRTIGIDPTGIALTQVRHTAFRLTLEERPDLGSPGEIDAFARNGHTSASMLHKHYLKYIEIEQSTKKYRITKSSVFEMFRGESVDGI